jgi:outer membrane protein assembly factor BamB
VNGNAQIIAPASGMVAAYEPAKGTEIWRVKYNGYSLIPRPIFGDGLLFIATGYDSPVLDAIRPDGKGDVTSSNVVWTVKRAVPHTASLLFAHDDVYMVSDGGVASCLDAKTGEVYWSERIGGNYSASPILCDDKIYFTSEEGQGTVVAAAHEFKVLQKNDLKEKTFASFAAVDGALFVRTEKNLYRFEEK